MFPISLGRGIDRRSRAAAGRHRRRVRSLSRRRLSRHAPARSAGACCADGRGVRARTSSPSTRSTRALIGGFSLGDDGEFQIAGLDARRARRSRRAAGRRRHRQLLLRRARRRRRLPGDLSPAAGRRAGRRRRRAIRRDGAAEVMRRFHEPRSRGVAEVLVLVGSAFPRLRGSTAVSAGALRSLLRRRPRHRVGAPQPPLRRPRSGVRRRVAGRRTRLAPPTRTCARATAARLPAVQHRFARSPRRPMLEARVAYAADAPLRGRRAVSGLRRPELRTLDFGGRRKVRRHSASRSASISTRSRAALHRHAARAALRVARPVRLGRRRISPAAARRADAGGGRGRSITIGGGVNAPCSRCAIAATCSRARASVRMPAVSVVTTGGMRSRRQRRGVMPGSRRPGLSCDVLK